MVMFLPIPKIKEMYKLVNLPRISQENYGDHFEQNNISYNEFCLKKAPHFAAISTVLIPWWRLFKSLTGKSGA